MGEMGGSSSEEPWRYVGFVLDITVYVTINEPKL
jgi:hypothetical protein